MSARARRHRRAGHIRFGGADLLPLSDRAMGRLRGDRIGMVFQEPMTSLNPAYTIGSQMTEVYRRHRGGGRAAAAERAAALLGRVGRERVMLASREFGTQLAHRGVLFGFTLATLFFLFRDGTGLAAQMRVASRRLLGPDGERLGQQVIASVHGTVDGLVLVGLGIGTALGFGYWLAGAPHPVLLGALTAVAATVPLGSMLVLALAALLVLATGTTVAAAVLLGAVMAPTDPVLAGDVQVGEPSE